METKLKRIAQISKEQPKTKFTSIYHLINKGLLVQCHKELDGNKAVGIDRMTKDMYNANLKENIKDLVTRLKNKAYKPSPDLRFYIPKGNGKMRPLGISINEDKIVQLALKKLLEAIYEPKFKENMFGFRPNIGCHQDVLVMWYKVVIERKSKGATFLVVYAYDFITWFQYKSEAEAYYRALEKRMNKFGLELGSSKSRLLGFGRFAELSRKQKGLGKPETFDFLGFTFYCSKTRKGKFSVKMKTSRKKFKQKIKAMRVWLYENRDVKTKDLVKALNRKLLGHYHYYGVSYNGRMMYNYIQRTIEMLFKVLNKRSNRRSYNWNGLNEMFKVYKIEMPKIYVSLFE